jgi:ribosomal protein L4
VLLTPEEDSCARSFRNIERVDVLAARDAGVADVVRAAAVVVSTAALDELARTALAQKAEA